MIFDGLPLFPPPVIPFSDVIGTITDTTVVKFRQK